MKSFKKSSEIFADLCTNSLAQGFFHILWSLTPLLLWISISSLRPYEKIPLKLQYSIVWLAAGWATQFHSMYYKLSKLRIQW